MAELKYVALSAKNLRKCWAWAEANQCELATWYISACCVLSPEPGDVLKNSGVGLDRSGAVLPLAWSLAYAAQQEAIRARDRIGRIILLKIAIGGKL